MARDISCAGRPSKDRSEYVDTRVPTANGTLARPLLYGGMTEKIAFTTSAPTQQADIVSWYRYT
jgi:hypothetical protein